MKVSSAGGVHPDTILSGMNLKGRTGAAALLFSIGSLLILFLATVTVLVSLWFALGKTITGLHLPVAAAIAILVTLAAGIRENIKFTWVSLAIVVAVLIALSATALAALFYDLSWDGQAIHQEAVLQLAGGWNPVHSLLDNSVQHAVWLNHYAKGPWFQAASIYELTHSIESGKAAGILLIVVSWMFVTAFLLKLPTIPAWLTVVISTIIALNPVSLYQSLTFYVDGQLASLYISLFALLLAAFFRPDRYILLTCGALALLMVNTKFTGLVYAVILVAAFGCAVLFTEGWKRTLRLSGVPLAGLLVGVLLVGYSPYIKNLRDQGNPFYPLLGNDAIDIISPTKPLPMQTMNRLEALATSIFSVSSNSNKTVTLKQPFKWPAKGELDAFSAYDVRVGGWGPWFATLLILALPIAVLVFTACKSPYTKGALAFVLATIGVTVLINPEAWWARYVPQVFLLPMAVCIAYFHCFLGKLRMLGFIVLAAATLNLLMVALPQAGSNIAGTVGLSRQLSAMANTGSPFTVYFYFFAADRIRLKEAGVSYSTVSSEERLPCQNPETLRGSFEKVKFCPGHP